MKPTLVQRRVCWDEKGTTANTDHLLLMLGQRRRRRPNIKTASGERRVFAGTRCQYVRCQQHGMVVYDILLSL